MIVRRALADNAFEHRIDSYVARVEAALAAALPGAGTASGRLHEAMRYAVLSGGKRVRPLLVYAAGEALGVPPEKLDPPAAAIELIHAFSLVHDDLPAMDDDDLRRGQPTVHRQFDEATAILAADALQPLAFEVIARSPALADAEIAALVALIASACGSLGMTGGQAIDLASEGRRLSVDEMTEMHALKTGALIHAAVMSAACVAGDIVDRHRNALDRFARDIGLAFQIRDDLLDVEGRTDVIGKPAGSDRKLRKATWPALFGVEASKARCDELLASAMAALTELDDAAEPLCCLAEFIVARAR